MNSTSYTISANKAKNIVDFYAKNLIEKDGIYFSGDVGKISYPADGNDICFRLEDNSFWFRHRNNCITALVKRYAKDSVFFDIGGGNGFVSKGLEESGITTCLVEPGVYGCLNAKKRGLANVINSDLKNAGFIEGVISAAGLFDVIEHIDDDIDFLYNINTYMSDGGVLFISVPAYALLWSKEDADAGHYRRYMMRKLKKKLAIAGFETVYSTYIFSFLVPPIFLFRTVPSLLGISKGGTEKGEREHRVGADSISSKLLKRLMDFEAGHIERGRRIPFGGSCLVVAEKKC